MIHYLLYRIVTPTQVALVRTLYIARKPLFYKYCAASLSLSRELIDVLLSLAKLIREPLASIHILLANPLSIRVKA